jgi:hypothetical protein
MSVLFPFSCVAFDVGGFFFLVCFELASRLHTPALCEDVWVGFSSSFFLFFLVIPNCSVTAWSGVIVDCRYKKWAKQTLTASSTEVHGSGLDSI